MLHLNPLYTHTAQHMYLYGEKPYLLVNIYTSEVHIWIVNFTKQEGSQCQLQVAKVSLG